MRNIFHKASLFLYGNNCFFPAFQPNVKKMKNGGGVNSICFACFVNNS